MEALRRLKEGVLGRTQAQEDESKQVLIDALSFTLNQLLTKYAAVDGPIPRHDEDVLEVCRALEDIFLHGIKPASLSLKDKLLLGSLASHEAQYSALWTFFCQLSHSDQVNVIEDLPLANSTAKCKAWIRLSLNDRSIHHYLDAVVNDKQTADIISSAYQPFALLRDIDLEKPEILRTMLRPLYNFDFHISIGDLCSRPGQDSAQQQAQSTQPQSQGQQQQQQQQQTYTPPAVLAESKALSRSRGPSSSSQWVDNSATSGDPDETPSAGQSSDAEIVATKSKSKKKKKKGHQRVRSITGMEENGSAFTSLSSQALVEEGAGLEQGSDSDDRSTPVVSSSGGMDAGKQPTPGTVTPKGESTLEQPQPPSQKETVRQEEQREEMPSARVEKPALSTSAMTPLQAKDSSSRLNATDSKRSDQDISASLIAATPLPKVGTMDWMILEAARAAEREEALRYSQMVSPHVEEAKDTSQDSTVERKGSGWQAHQDSQTSLLEGEKADDEASVTSEVQNLTASITSLVSEDGHPDRVSVNRMSGRLVIGGRSSFKHDIPSGSASVDPEECDEGSVQNATETEGDAESQRSAAESKRDSVVTTLEEADKASPAAPILPDPPREDEPKAFGSMFARFLQAPSSPRSDRGRAGSLREGFQSPAMSTDSRDGVSASQVRPLSSKPPETTEEFSSMLSSAVGKSKEKYRDGDLWSTMSTVGSEPAFGASVRDSPTPSRISCDDAMHHAKLGPASPHHHLLQALGDEAGEEEGGEGETHAQEAGVSAAAVGVDEGVAASSLGLSTSSASSTAVPTPLGGPGVQDVAVAGPLLQVYGLSSLSNAVSAVTQSILSLASSWLVPSLRSLRAQAGGGANTSDEFLHVEDDGDNKVIIYEEKEALMLLAGILELCPEKGLVFQSFKCLNCEARIGPEAAEARLCDYTGRYFCPKCHEKETQIIPARVLQSWDFSPRMVSKRSAAFLKFIAAQPLFIVTKISPALFDAVTELHRAAELRNEIHQLFVILSSCDEGRSVPAKSRLWPREHIWAVPEQYSLTDFVEIQSGQHIKSLSELKETMVKHIHTCQSCMEIQEMAHGKPLTL